MTTTASELLTLADGLSRSQRRFLKMLPASVTVVDWRSLPAMKRKGLVHTEIRGWVWPTTLGTNVRDALRGRAAQMEASNG